MIELTVLLSVFAIALMAGIILIELLAPKKNTAGGGRETDLQSRVERLERLVFTNMNSVFSHDLGDRLHKLDNFKANTRVDIEGLREMIEEVKKEKEWNSKGKIKGKKTMKANSGKILGKEELDAKEMSKLVFRE